MYAIKANRQYKITEDEKQRYIDQGYRIAELVEGKLIFEEVATEEAKKIEQLEADYERLQEEHSKALEELEEYKAEKTKKTKGEGK